MANKSKVYVVAIDASFYSGIKIGKYFRNMGYNVSMMAEDLRKFLGCLTKMSADTGFPIYL